MNAARLDRSRGRASSSTSCRRVTRSRPPSPRTSPASRSARRRWRSRSTRRPARCTCSRSWPRTRRAPRSTRLMVEGQIEGSVVQGIGFALMERLVRDDGTDPQRPFPRLQDRQHRRHAGDRGRLRRERGYQRPATVPKASGSPGLVPTAPAIANAIYDAIGVRFHELPITPDKVLKALEARRSN